jgi:catechol 2,3-dioxygenase-like lactoylglutathione lyase family enzyme
MTAAKEKVVMKLAGTCLYVDDVAAVLDFYRRAFGFGTRFFDEALQFAELDTGGAPGAPPILSFASHQCAEVLMPGRYVRPEGGGPSGVEVAFYTDDVPAAFARAVEAGAVVIAEPKVMPWGQTVAYVRCPDGVLVELCTAMG